MPTYTIDVYTGRLRADAANGTDANVYVTLYGTKASSDELRVGRAGHDFGRTGVDTFSAQVADLGDVTRVHVRHDNTGVAPGWFLDRLIVRARDAAGAYREWTFPCHRWLARHEDDGAIERVLDAA
jgi:hypothetical protein